MGELKEEKTDQSKENKTALSKAGLKNNPQEEQVRCSNCGHIGKAGDFKCPVCGKIYWKKAFFHYTSVKSIRLWAGIGTICFLAMLAVGFYGMKNVGDELQTVLETEGETTSQTSSESGSVSETQSDTEEMGEVFQVKFGEQNYTMPDLLGLPQDKAQRALECMGVQVVFQEIEAPGIADGCVAQQSIEPYQALNRGDSVVLSVAKNPTVKAGEVVDFTGIDYEQAVKLAAENDVSLVVTEKVFQDISENTEVIAQDTAVGETVEEGQSVGVTVALKTREFRMPDMQGIEQESAQQIMDNIGADVTIQYEENLDMTNGMVFDQNIGEGEILIPGTGVILKITQNEHIVVPEVIGMTQNEAVAKLEGIGLTVEIQYDATSSQEKDYVISQSIPGNSIITIGSGVKKIILVISDPAGTQVYVEVPDVVGYSAESAKSLMQNKGFQVSFSYVENSKAKGTVLRQSVKAGEKILYASEILLTVSNGPANTGSTGSTGGSGTGSTGSTGSSSTGNTVTGSDSTSSVDTGRKIDINALDPDEPWDRAVLTLIQGGVPKEEIESGKWDREIEIFMSSFKFK